MKHRKDKYRILLVIRWPVGGIRSFIRYVYCNFDPLRYHITIVAPDIAELQDMLSDLKGYDVTCKTFSADTSNRGMAVFVMKTIALEQYDLIHSHGFTAGLYSTLPAYIKRIKHLMTIHDTLSERQFHGLLGSLKRRTLSFLLPKVDVIHSVSNDANNNLLKYITILKKQHNNCRVIPNGIDVECCGGSTKRDFLKELNLADDTFLIGFMGRFMSLKGFKYLIEALDQLLSRSALPKKPVILTFGGGGFIREEQKYIKKKGLDKHIHFLPFTQDVATAMRGLDVVAVPSIREACPLLPMEAMVAGVPVIGTNCIGLREVLEGTPCKIVPAANSSALADALFDEMNRPSKQQALEFCNNARVRFDVKKSAKEIEKIIIELLEC